jgi:hypothetical protein
VQPLASRSRLIALSQAQALLSNGTNVCSTGDECYIVAGVRQAVAKKGTYGPSPKDEDSQPVVSLTLVSPAAGSHPHAGELPATSGILPQVPLGVKGARTVPFAACLLGLAL